MDDRVVKGLHLDQKPFQSVNGNATLIGSNSIKALAYVV